MLQSLKNIIHFLVALFWLYYFGNPAKKINVIAVTGTDGKTTTTSLIYHVLKTNNIKTSMITSIKAVIAGKNIDTGFHVTTPDSYYIQKYLNDAVKNGDKYMILELTSHAISQFRALGIKFKYVVLTNITHEHLDYHKTFENYMNTKFRLFHQADKVIISIDDKLIYKKAYNKFNKKLITYSLKNSADFSFKDLNLKLNIPGEYNKANALACYSVCYLCGLNDLKIKNALLAFNGVAGRYELIYHKKFDVIVDFAHTPNALESILTTVKSKKYKKLVHIFGCAGQRDYTKRPIMGGISSKYSDIIILTEEDYRTEDINSIFEQILKGIKNKKEIYKYNNRGEAIDFALTKLSEGDVLVLTGKGHEKSLCRGNIEYPWNDKDYVLSKLN